MKYMGSKRKMLQNGLGTLLRHEMRSSRRFVDLFAGSGAVVRYVASRFKKSVVAVDLQHFSTIIANASLGRLTKIKGTDIVDDWILRAREVCDASELNEGIQRWVDSCGRSKLLRKDVLAARKLCGNVSSEGVTWNAYGGHYLSPRQALQVDSLLACLPETHRVECLAALIVAVSKSVASPGHTAQPFQPTKDALPYIEVAWGRDIFECVRRDFKVISKVRSRVLGGVFCGDAQVFVDQQVRDGDLVFIDPPYSGVQYSRFYHVLETIANAHKVAVSGKGRYPELGERPQSVFSNKGTSRDAMSSLLVSLSKRRLTAVITFPSGECSNGLSGEWIVKEAAKYFNVSVIRKKNDFSTLGGNNAIREARQEATEFLILLKHRGRKTIKAQGFHS